MLAAFARRLLRCLCRINQGRRSGPVLHVCCCCSSLHVMANLADPALVHQPAILIRSIHAKHLLPLAERLGFRCLPPNAMLVKVILVAWIFGGGRIRAWVPHLSPLDFPPSLLAVLLQLEAYGSLRYIDDGLACVSRDTLVYRQGWVPRRALIHSWDYWSWSEPAAARFPATANRSSFARALQLVQCRDPTLCTQGRSRLESLGLSGAAPGERPRRVSMVLASRYLDAICVREQLAVSAQACPAVYLPHYNVAKNDPALMAELPLLHLDVPEFGLLGVSQYRPFSLFFGVTSTVLVLLELLLRTPGTCSVEFVCCAPGHGGMSSADEQLSFRHLLAQYRDMPGFSAKGLSMVL